MLGIFKLLQHIDGDGAANAVVPCFGKQHFFVIHHSKFKIRDCHITWLDSPFHRFFAAGSTDINEHILDVDRLFAGFRRKDMRRLGSDDACNVPFASYNGDTLGKHNL
ncbi:Uncharacterised protein [Mycobacteroides abscessus subsp. abscessus]|nr:Uncharacterised protein [Mycobacteroides abscessus subsp. abscessus]